MLKRMSALLLTAASLCSAAVVSVELSERSDVLDGKSFGTAGPYERLIGRVHFGADPRNPANRIVSDIDKAPVNVNGLVEFSADLYVLKPRDPKAGNHAVLFEVSNRGGKGMLSMFDRAPGSPDPRTAAQFGDGFLLEQGYTLVWLGWQFDVPQQNGLLRLYAPVATDNGKPITGRVRAEFTPDTKTVRMPLADRNHRPYRVAVPDDPSLELTVRDTVTGQRTVIPRSAWELDGDNILMQTGFTPGRLYEFVYTARDPVLVGLGSAAVRDFISFLKYGGTETTLNDQKNFKMRAYGWGVSQSGRFLRKFLADGFNADENNRQVFDGVMAHVAGGGQGSFNSRFAQPSRDGHPFLNTLYPTDVPPFNDEDLLAKARQTNTVPKIFYTDSSYEYWGRSAALVTTTADGSKDAPLADTSRLYFFAGGQHGPAAFPPPQNGTQNPSSPVAYTWSMRALLTAMDRWVKDGAEPPASQYPKIGQDNLVAPGAIQFPKIPGVQFPSAAAAHRAYDADYSVQPPRIRGTLPVLLPQVDRDGIDMGGVRMPEVAVPLATFTGWNLRAASLGAPTELYSMQGSFIPFPKTRADRERTGDPRLSVAERYAGKQDFLQKVGAAANGLVTAGFLLERDVPKVVERSAAEWDWLNRR